MANEFIKLLKENWIGGLIGGYLFYWMPTILIINIQLGFTQETAILIGNIISIFIGVTLGAFIQSKIKG